VLKGRTVTLDKKRYVSNVSARTRRNVEQSGLGQPRLHCTLLTNAQTVTYFLDTQ